MRHCASKQLSLNDGQLFRLQSRLSSCLRCTGQRLSISAMPRQPPLTDTLTTNPQRVSNGSLPFPLFEESDSFQSRFRSRSSLFFPLSKETIMPEMKALVRRFREAQ